MGFDWKKAIGDFAPGLATMFGGPLAGGAVSLLSKKLLGKEGGTEEDIATLVASGDPNTILKIKEVEATLKTELKRLDVEGKKIEGEIIKDINTTMQAEAKSDHWMQKSWRPVVGFTFAAVIINNYILLPYFSGLGLVPIEIPSGVWQAMLIVLGVAAGTRGLEKWEREKKKKI